MYEVCEMYRVHGSAAANLVGNIKKILLAITAGPLSRNMGLYISFDLFLNNMLTANLSHSTKKILLATHRRSPLPLRERDRVRGFNRLKSL